MPTSLSRSSAALPIGFREHELALQQSPRAPAAEMKRALVIRVAFEDPQHNKCESLEHWVLYNLGDFNSICSRNLTAPPQRTLRRPRSIAGGALELNPE